MSLSKERTTNKIKSNAMKYSTVINVHHVTYATSRLLANAQFCADLVIEVSECGLVRAYARYLNLSWNPRFHAGSNSVLSNIRFVSRCS